MNAAFSLMQRFLRDASGLALDDDKRYMLEDRLQPIMRAADIASLDDLACSLHGDSRSELARAVVEALTINETSFFRDKSLFAVFSDTMLPALVASRAEQRRLRIWCSGCSTGQEPYSLAMLIDEQSRKLTGWQIEIVATDLSRAVIDHARRGLYSQFEVQRGLPVAMLLRHFRREGDKWQISDHLRAKVDFKPRNLMANFRDLGTFDVIFCRNVLIYFDVTTKRRILANLSDCMAPDGYMALGAAESVTGLSDRLKPVSDRNFVFVKDGRQAIVRRPMAAYSVRA